MKDTCLWDDVTENKSSATSLGSPNKSISPIIFLIISQWLRSSKGAIQCTKTSAYAWSEKRSHHLVYCAQPYHVFTQDVVSRTYHIS